MTRVVLARHGESEWHREDRYVGVSDIGLTERGRAQGHDLAGWAASQGFAAIVSSPLRRCRETARETGLVTGLDVVVDERLRELDFGIAEGKRRADLEADHAEAYARFVTDPVTHHFPQGEDPRSAAVRFVAGLQGVAAAHPDARVLVVAHSTVIRLALCELLGIDLARYRTAFPRLNNGCVTEVTFGSAGAGLLSLNLPLGVEGDPA